MRSLCTRALCALALALGLGATSPAFAQEAYEWDRVAIGGGGYITGLAFQPAVPGLLYARSDTAGLFRWDTEAQRWINLTDHGGAKSVASIAVDPGAGNDPSRQDVVYAAFGAYFNTLQTGGTAKDNGIYRSTDRGETWTKLWDGVTTKFQNTYGTDTVVSFAGNGPNRSYGEQLAVDPLDPDVLYVGTGNGGLWRSTDARAEKPTFARLEGAPVGFTNSGYSPRGIQVVLIDERQGAIDGRSRVVYIALESSKTTESPSFDGGIWRSDDGGETWTKLDRGEAPKAASRMALGPGDTVLVAERRQEKEGSGHDDNHPATRGGIYSYDPTANSWTKLPETDGHGFERIATDPRDRSRIVTAESGTTSLWRSTDGGATWTKKGWNRHRNTADNNAGLYFDDVSWSVPGFQYPLGADVEFDPNNPGDVWFCDAFGIHRTDDVWAEAVRFEPKLMGLENTVVFDLLAPAAGDTLLYVTVADVSGWQIKDLDTLPPNQLVQDVVASTGDPANGDAVFTSMAAAPSDPAKVALLRMTQGGYYNTLRRIYVSLDAGRTWTAREVPGVDAEGQPGFGPGKIAISSTEPNRAVFIGPHTDIKHTDNLFAADEPIRWSTGTGGTRMTDTWVYNSASTRLVADAADGRTFYYLRYAEGSTIQVYRSTDGGATWAVANAQPLHDAPWPNGGQAAMQSVVDPQAGGSELWISTGANGLWRSGDRGQTFAKVDGVEKAQGFAFGAPRQEGGVPTLFLAGSLASEPGEGVFRSLDLGETWTRITRPERPMLNGGVRDMEGDPRVFGRVFIGTGGSGVVVGAPVERDGAASSTR